MLSLFLYSPMHAGLLLLCIVPVSVWAYRRLGWKTEEHWVAARYALIASWMGALGWTGYTIVAVALSKRSTAFLGLFFIPIEALVVGLLCFAVSWLVFLLVLRARRPTPPHAAAAYVSRLIRRDGSQ